jgi:hypothetical protein
VDYINADTSSFRLSIVKGISGTSIPFDTTVSDDEGPLTYQIIPDNAVMPDNAETFYLPLYIGIGLRVTADIRVLRANTKIGGLGIIGAEADAGNLSGSLVVQTLGVNGKSISAALPIQSELNRTTAQNAIVSIGSIKALLYEQDTVVSPRVVGLYFPLGSTPFSRTVELRVNPCC